MRTLMVISTHFIAVFKCCVTFLIENPKLVSLGLSINPRIEQAEAKALLSLSLPPPLTIQNPLYPYWDNELGFP